MDSKTDKPAPKDDNDSLKTLAMPELMKRLGASPDGLTQAEATKRQAQYGPTDLTRPIGDWKEAWERAKERAGRNLYGRSDESQPAKCEYLRKKKTDGARQEKPAKVTNKRSDSKSLKCRFHDLRHSAVTRLLEAGIPYPVVASIMGWSAATAIRMAKRYGHIGQKALRDAVDVLGREEIGAVSLKKSPKSESEQYQVVQ